MYFTFNFRYAAWTFLLLITEVCIALYVKDQFIRPFIGDLLVVILLYTLLKTFTLIKPHLALWGVLVFSFLIEMLQSIHFVEWLGINPHSLLGIALGNSFDWGDMLAYLGGGFCVWLGINSKSFSKWWQKVRYNVIFPNQLAFGVFFLRLFGDNRYCKNLQRRLKSLPENTVGKEMYRLLSAQNLQLVPFYIEHDLKHAILGYKMEAPEEMKMQAFMIGNSGFNLFHSTVSLFFVIWTHEIWHQLYYHYKLGKSIQPIAHWKAEDVIHKDLKELRKRMNWDISKLGY